MNEFPKTKRLLNKNEYDNVFGQANRLITPEFIILYVNNTIGHARLGLAISKKMVAKSHDRNRLKRLLRETFRTATLPALDIVVLAKRGVKSVRNPTLITHLNGAWSKLAG